MGKAAQVLEVIGPLVEAEWKGAVRDGLLGWVDREGRLRVYVDDYNPGPLGEFDLDEFEAHQCCMEASPTRVNWKILYAIGRGLVRHGKVTVHQPGRPPLEVACDGRELIIE